MMKVRLLRDARINHKAGEIVEVSPTEYGFLIDVRSAVPVEDEAKPATASEPEKEAEPKKTIKAASALKKATTRKK